MATKRRRRQRRRSTRNNNRNNRRRLFFGGLLSDYELIFLKDKKNALQDNQIQPTIKNLKENFNINIDDKRFQNKNGTEVIDSIINSLQNTNADYQKIISCFP